MCCCDGTDNADDHDGADGASSASELGSVVLAMVVQQSLVCWLKHVQRDVSVWTSTGEEAAACIIKTNTDVTYLVQTFLQH